MDWGMANRMSQLIQPDGRCMFLPIDHGYFQGPTRKLEQPGETIKPLLPYSDALFATRGVVRAVVDPAASKPIILRVSGGTSMLGADLANEGITTSMEDAVRLNVAAVGISVFIGSEYEKELDQRESRYLALCCRICAELGAKVVKTYWCDDGFDKVVNGCPVPVVMAGGPQADTEVEVLEFVHDGIQNGSIGINLGRNVWQSDHPVPMIRALRHIVHGNGSVKEASEIYDSVKAGEGQLASVPV
jgi:putative autoinducer-2 (AI-2) aldolase